MTESWTAALMRRIYGAVGSSRTTAVSSTTEVWLLGVCYKFSQEEKDASESSASAFEHDLSSRILVTYRKGFDAIESGESKCFTSDVNWGCMIRSSQMLVAQALLFHKLGREWRRKPERLDREYIEILRQFGDSAASDFSIHNLIQAGKGYSLAAGSWVGPYAMCRSWEALVRSKHKDDDDDGGEEEHPKLPMALHIVSGDENGERGGAPVVCIEDVARHCVEFSRGGADWTPMLLLVPLVLGLEELNPRYIPSLKATFTFPQSVGIMGGKPGVSTYIIGVQDENAVYLDPHQVQPAVNLREDDLGKVDSDATSSFHCNVLRHMPLNSIDPSLAIGFYCRDRNDFDDFCVRASKLAEQSNGAPLFTVTAEAHSSPRSVGHSDDVLGDNDDDGNNEDANEDESSHEDDWQLL